MEATNIFEEYQEHQKRKVDSPYYEPLKQRIINEEDIAGIISREELRRAKKRARNKKYYENRTEEQKIRDREYHRRYYAEHKNDREISKAEQKTIEQRIYKDTNEPTELQQRVYDYMLEKYKETGSIPRASQIANELQKTDASIYSVISLLVKKGKLFKGAMGHLYFSSDFESKKPEMVYVEEDNYDGLVEQNTNLYNQNLELRQKIKDLEDVASKKKHISGQDYSPGYVAQLKASIKHGAKIIGDLRRENKDLRKEVEQYREDKIRQDLTGDEIASYEKKNIELVNQVEELKLVVKILSKYFS